MFREMRLKKQELTKERTEEILYRGTSGVLAVLGDDEYPYAVPLSYVYDGNRIYFHGAKTGHKLDAAGTGKKVSFCVIDKDEVVVEDMTSYYRSAVVFGRIRSLKDAEEKRAALVKLGEKYLAGTEEQYLPYIEKSLDHVNVMEVSIDHMTGKEAGELCE